MPIIARRSFGFFLASAFAGASAPDAFSQNRDKEIPSKEDILLSISKFSPRARADIVDAIVQHWEEQSGAQINTPKRFQHFLAQIAAETGGLTTLSENMNYSANRLRVIFKNRVSSEQAKALAGDQVAIANHVYGGKNGARLGNNAIGDGWRYRGGGLIQLTGRANYTALGQKLGLPLEQNPEFVRTPRFALKTATAYWTYRNINAAADADDIELVRRRVNGGAVGLNEARIWLARARKVGPRASMPTEADAPTLEEANAIANQLQALGYLKPSVTESAGGQAVSTALRKFQEKAKVEVTGVFDEDTLYELTNPQNFQAFADPNDRLGG